MSKNETKSEVSLQQFLLSAAKAIFITFGAREQLPAPHYLHPPPDLESPLGV